MADEDGATLADVMPGETASVVEQAMEPTPAAEPQPVIDAQGRSYATGKRKNAVARVWLKPGSGKYTINGRDWETYFARPTLRMIINEPFATVDGLKMAKQHMYFTSAKARAVLGYSPRPAVQGLADAVLLGGGALAGGGGRTTQLPPHLRM